MSGAAQRAEFAAVGRDILAVLGGAGDRRAAALVVQPGERPPTAFAPLLDAPLWLRWPRPRQVRLAELVGVRAIAGTLASSIDGAWLGRIAEMVGEDAVDWAIGMNGGASGPAATILPGDLAPLGFAILHAGLPPSLRSYLAWAPRHGAMIAAPDSVRPAVAFAGGLDA